jgi:hypothetical protein
MLARPGKDGIGEPRAFGFVTILATRCSGPERWTAMITRADSAQSAAMMELKKALVRDISAVAPLLNKLSAPGDRLG